MDRRFGYFLFLGLAFGALLGVAFGAARGNALLGLGFGALAGVFIGWFAAAVAMQRERRD